MQNRCPKFAAVKTVWLGPAKSATDRQTWTVSFVLMPGIAVLQDLLRLYKFAFVLQLVTLIPYLLRAHRYHEPASNVINKLLETLVQSAPPPVVAIMLLCGFAAVVRLKKHGIKLLYPEMLKLGASCDVVCFDKTGTLTGTTVCSSCQLAVTCHKHA